MNKTELKQLVRECFSELASEVDLQPNVVVKEEDAPSAEPVSELKRTQADFEGGKRVRALTQPPVKVQVKVELKTKSGEVALQRAETVDVYFSEKTRSHVYVFTGGKWWSLGIPNAHKYLTKFKPAPKNLNSLSDSVVTTPIGNRVEPDGVGPNGDPSWLLVMGLI